MNSKISAAPGSWKSNIEAFHVANGSSRLADIRTHRNCTYWLESVAAENGRMTIMRDENGSRESILPQAYNVRSKVHEYGGAPYCVCDEGIFFINAKDQALYHLAPGDSQSSQAAIPTRIAAINNKRFGDLAWHTQSRSIIAVAETHLAEHVVENTLVNIQLNGRITPLLSTLANAEGHNEANLFFAYPRITEDGSALCWISWSHPNMPWDATTLYTADLTFGTQATSSEDTPLAVSNIKHVVQSNASNNTSNNESIVQPTWLNDNRLLYVSDRSDWWNIYCYNDQARTNGAAAIDDAFFSHDAEYATPLWVLGMQNFAVCGDTVFASFTRNGEWYIRQINLTNGESTTLPHTFASVESMHSNGHSVYFIASTTTSFASVFQLEPSTLALTQISQIHPVEQADISKPKAINHLGVHAFYYPAHNTLYTSDAPSPLIVLCHGGPTGQTSAELYFKIQYWCSRGFSVVDVNYRGSTGFGRRYRQTLYGQWGVFDVEDVVSTVDYLIAQGWVDAEKIVIKGSSAGGYTVLAALAFSERFNAGVSLYGIGDLELLATDTHKFEQHYLDQLIGPYPKDKQLYIERSPIQHLDKINCPVLLFQGLEDNVVPPNQARAMADNVRNKGLAVSLVEFEDEGHGFRSPRNIEHMLNAELYFYQRIFDLPVSAETPPIIIDNLG